MQYVSATNGVSVYHGNNRLRDRADLFLYIQHIQARYTVGSYITSVSFYVHVATGTEGFVAGSGQYHYIDVLTLAAVVQRIADFSRSSWSERIAVAGTIDGNLGYAIIKLEKNILVFFDGFPFSLL